MIYRLLLLLLCATSAIAQPSYWFQQFQRQGNAQLAQQYEFVAGPGIVFGFDGVHSVVSAIPGGPVNIQLFGDVTSPLTLLPNVTTTLKLTGTAGTYTKTTFDAQGRETAGASAILASADYLNQGSIHTLLHGNAAGNPSWAAVDLATEVGGLLPNGNLANSSLTYNGQTVSLGGSGTLTLASSDYQNQGTTVTLLHGNAAGNPSWAKVNLATETTGSLPAGSSDLNTNVWFLNGNTVGSTNTILGTLDNNPLKLFEFGQVMMELRTDKSISIGPSNTTALQSIAIGTNNFATGTNSVCIGSPAPGANTSSGQQSICIGSACTASGTFAIAIGTGSSALGYQSGAFGGAAGAAADYSMALGKSSQANNPGSFAWHDSLSTAATSDTTSNQFTVIARGGAVFNNGGNGLLVNDKVGITTQTISLTNGTARAPRSIIDAGTTTNGYYNAPSANGVSGATTLSPLGMWGFLSLTNAQNINVAVTSTYYPITNFNYIYTNVFTGGTNTGFLTNAVAGWYRIGIHASIAAPQANDSCDCDLLLNGVADERIASHNTAPANSANFFNLASSGILFLPAGTQIGVGITDTSHTGNINVLHAQLTVGSP